MNILVTGANGQLGNEMRLIASQLKTQKPEFTFLFTDVCEASDEAKAMLRTMASDDVDTSTTILDITNFEAISQLVIQNSIHACVNCAAWTNVDGAEDPDKYDLVELLNAKAPENLAIAMKEANGLLVHISTDYVFDGQGTRPWEPEDERHPLNVYGQTKLEGELAVANTLEKYFIVRIAWVFGLNGKNFIKTMLNVGKTHDEVRVVNDQIGTPTYTLDLARLLVDMMETDKYGYYHATNEGGYISWYDFTLEIYKQAGLNTKVVPVTTKEYGLSKAARPFNSRLDKSKLVENGFAPLPIWQDALSRFLAEIGEK